MFKYALVLKYRYSLTVNYLHMLRTEYPILFSLCFNTPPTTTSPSHHCHCCVSWMEKTASLCILPDNKKFEMGGTLVPATVTFGGNKLKM